MHKGHFNIKISNVYYASYVIDFRYEHTQLNTDAPRCLMLSDPSIKLSETELVF